ncbi:MAG: hypothetical protein LUD17_08395 [Bacteroidales bacterium]|nr:hypothetical protein [Bacteroidales bacterium]
MNNTDLGEVESISIPINLNLSPSTYSYDSSKAVYFYKDFVEYSVTVEDLYGMGFAYGLTPSCANGEITEAGSYTLYIPEGAFSDGSSYNEEANFTWTVVSSATATTLEPMSISPEAGSTISVGQQIVLSFPESIAFADEYAKYNVSFVIGGNHVGSFAPADVDGDIIIVGSMLAVNFNPDSWQTYDGTPYILTIPEGTLVGESGLTNELIEVVYNTPEATVEPVTGLEIALKNNKTLGEVESISNPIRFDLDPSTVTYNNVALTFYKDEVSYSTSVEEYNLFGTGYWQVRIDNSVFESEITEDGTYTLLVPAGAFSLGEYTNEETTFTWIIGDVTPGDEPEANIEYTAAYPLTGEYDVAIEGSFSSVNLSFGGVSAELTVNPNKVVSLINVETGDETICDIAYNATFSNMIGYAYVNITFDEITETGDYQLIIPQATLTDPDGNYNPEIILFYNVIGQSTGDLKEMEFVSVTPSNDEPLYALLEGESVVLGVTNANQAGYGRLTITGGPEGYVTQFGNDAYVTFTENEAIFENAQKDFTFYEGYEYTFTFELFDKYAAPRTTLFEHSVVYQGATPNTVFFSAITVSEDSFNPVPGSELTPEANTVVLTFDAPATLVDGYATNGGQMAETTDLVASSNEDGTIWNLTVPASYVEGIWGDITLIMTFTDADGAYIIPGEASFDLYTYYNSEAGAMTSIAARYDCYQKGDVAVVTPAAGQVSELHEFSFTYADGITWGGTVRVSEVKLYNEAGEVVAYGESYTEVDDYNVTVTLNPTITENGKYTLDVPRFALSLGFEYIATGYKGQTVEYTIGTTGINDALFDGQLVDVYTIQGIRVLTNANAAQINALPRGLYIAGGKKIVIR